MEELTPQEMIILANYIREEIDQNFANRFVTRNLVNTISIYNTINEEDGTTCVRIEIPAEIYDYKLWDQKRVLVYTGEGSYASEVDQEGGYSRSHKNYVQKAIDEAMARFFKEKSLEVNVKNG